MRFYFILILLLSYSALSAQSISPVIQSGHSDKIEFYSVNYTNNALLTADKKEVILWNLNSGKQLRRIMSPFTIKGAAFVSDGEEVAVISYDYGKDASLRIYNARNGVLVATIDWAEKNAWGGTSYKTLDQLIVDKMYNRVAVKYFNEISIVDIKTRSKLQLLKLASYDNKFAFTADKNTFVITSKEEGSKVALVDASIKMIKSALASITEPLSISTNNKQDKFYVLDKKAVLYIFDNTLQLVDSVRSDSVSSVSSLSPPLMALSQDENKILLPLHKNQYLYDLEKKQWQVNGWKWINTGTGLLFADEEALRVVNISSQFASIIDSDNGEELHALIPKTIETSNLLFSPSGRMMSTYTTSSYSKASAVLYLKTGIQFNEEEVNYPIYQWLNDSLVLCTTEDGYDNDGNVKQQVQLRNIYNGNVLQSVVAEKSGSLIAYAALSADQKKLAYILSKKLILHYGDRLEKKMVYNFPGTATASNVYFTPDSKRLVLPMDVIRIFDIEKNKWSRLADTASYSYSRVFFTPDGKEMWYDDYRKKKPGEFMRYQSVMVHDLQTGITSVRRMSDTLISTLAIHPSEDLYAIGYFNGTVEWRRRSNDSLLFREKEQAGVVGEILFQPSKQWIICKGNDGAVKIRNIVTKQPVISIAALYENGERGYALITPDNYYLVPATVAGGLHYAKEFDTYSFAQLDLQLNRPDKVLQSLGFAEESLLQAHQKAFVRRLKKAGYSSEMLPDISSAKPVRVVNRKALKPVVQDSVIALSFHTEQPASSIRQFNLYVNGQKIEVISKAANEWKLQARLNTGINNIEAAYVMNNRMESLRERIEISYTPSAPVKSQTYYIGVAVSNYHDSSMNLKYAVKDVQDIATKFKQKDADAKTYLYIDSAVTKQNISAIKQMLNNTSVDDKVVVSFSGHGILDTAYNFYFAGWDMDFTDPAAKGISINDISALLEDIPARQKLILIDACHSGEVDRERFSFSAATADTQFVKTATRSKVKVKKERTVQNTVKLMEQYFSDVNRDNGINIISAAAGEEYALESGEWSNGVFSYSFMKGVFDKQADKDRNRKVSQSEIRKYMQQLVLKLTKGQQQPTSRNMNTDYNWEF